MCTVQFKTDECFQYNTIDGNIYKLLWKQCATNGLLSSNTELLACGHTDDTAIIFENYPETSNIYKALKKKQDCQ